MHRFHRWGRGLLALLVLAATVGCEDELPTATGDGRFPGGQRPVTLELVVPAEELVLDDTLYSGYTDPRDAGMLLVATRFGEGDGGPALEARTLKRFTGFPDSVTYSGASGSRTDTAFVYGAGRIVVPLDSALSVAAGPVTLRVWSLAQAWDAASVTWEVALDTGGVRQTWRTPGGTTAQLLSTLTYTPGDTLTRDSLVFALDSLAVARLAADSLSGVLITAEGAPSHLQVGGVTLRTAVRPASRPDTAIATSLTAGPTAFIYTPEAPGGGARWEVGGLASARTVFRVRLPRQVPACVPPATACGTIPLEAVLLNQAALVFRPQRDLGGFRPVGPIALAVRQVLQPELGRRAPLGAAVGGDTIGGARFRAGSPDSTVALPLSPAFLRSDSTEVVVALLASPEGAYFGRARFAGPPRLRLLYTLAQEPRLP